ncbi:hypothetical protein FXO38_16851 [Capsicum annuum]|nr:hypothetical protein FXO38_16851 [Capsicum annuum]
MYEEPVEVLPLTLHELYKQNSTNPPCGVLLYVPPGIKNNILVKVVANHTIMDFITIIDLEFVQKYLGECSSMTNMGSGATDGVAPFLTRGRGFDLGYGENSVGSATLEWGPTRHESELVWLQCGYRTPDETPQKKCSSMKNNKEVCLVMHF